MVLIRFYKGNKNYFARKQKVNSFKYYYNCNKLEFVSKNCNKLNK